MFWVINKDKIYSYMVTLSVIGVLFVMAAILPKNQTVQTSSNVVESASSISTNANNVINNVY